MVSSDPQLEVHTKINTRGKKSDKQILSNKFAIKLCECSMLCMNVRIYMYIIWHRNMNLYQIFLLVMCS